MRSSLPRTVVCNWRLYSSFTNGLEVQIRTFEKVPETTSKKRILRSVFLVLIDRYYGVSLGGRLYNLLNSGAGDGESFWPEASFIPNLPFTNCSEQVQKRLSAMRRVRSMQNTFSLSGRNSRRRTEKKLAVYCPLGCLENFFLRILVLKWLVLCHKIDSPNKRTICGDFRARVAWRKEDFW